MSPWDVVIALTTSALLFLGIGAQAWRARPLRSNPEARPGTCLWSVSLLLMVGLALWAGVSGYIDAPNRRYDWLFLVVWLALLVGVLIGGQWMRREELWQRWREDRNGVLERLHQTPWYHNLVYAALAALLVGLVVRFIAGSSGGTVIAFLGGAVLFAIGTAALFRRWDMRTVERWLEIDGARLIDARK